MRAFLRMCENCTQNDNRQQIVTTTCFSKFGDRTRPQCKIAILELRSCMFVCVYDNVHACTYDLGFFFQQATATGTLNISLTLSLATTEQKPKLAQSSSLECSLMAPPENLFQGTV